MRHDPITHNFGPGRRYYGHDYCVQQVTSGGQHLRASGWGHDGRLIQEGDYLLLEVTSNGSKRTTRYRVEKIERAMDPPDMWHADLAFAPRQSAAKDEKSAAR